MTIQFSLNNYELKRVLKAARHVQRHAKNYKDCRFTSGIFCFVEENHVALVSISQKLMAYEKIVTKSQNNPATTFCITTDACRSLEKITKMNRVDFVYENQSLRAIIYRNNGSVEEIDVAIDDDPYYPKHWKDPIYTSEEATGGIAISSSALQYALSTSGFRISRKDKDENNIAYSRTLPRRRMIYTYRNYGDFQIQINPDIVLPLLTDVDTTISIYCRNSIGDAVLIVIDGIHYYVPQIDREKRPT